MKTKTLVCVLVIFVFRISTQYGVAEDFDWPRWRGPNGNGISMETEWNPKALKGGPTILWKADVGWGYSNVAIKDNCLYTMGLKDYENHVFCLNAETGKGIWRYSFETKFIEPKSTPIVDNDRVYGLSAEGTLLCLKISNGKLLWEKDLKDDFNAWSTSLGWATSPVVDGDLLLLNADTVQLALNKYTGDLVWSVDDKRPSDSFGSYATTVISDYNGMRVALFLGPKTLNAVEVTTGKKLWAYIHSEELHPIADPIVFDDKVFISLTKWSIS